MDSVKFVIKMVDQQ